MCVEVSKEQIGGTRTTRTDPSPLAATLADFTPYAEAEREAIQWVESLSPEEGDAALKAAQDDWWKIVRGEA